MVNNSLVLFGIGLLILLLTLTARVAQGIESFQGRWMILAYLFMVILLGGIVVLRTVQGADLFSATETAYLVTLRELLVLGAASALLGYFGAIATGPPP